MSFPLKPIQVLLIVLFLVVSTGLSAEGQGDAEPVNLADLVGEVIFVEGMVTLNDRAANAGDEVRPGDRFVTGPSSIAEVTFGKRNIIQFRENSETVIEPEWGGVEISRGTMAAVLKGLEKLGFSDSKRFTVRTGTAVMAVRGTVFFIDHPVENQAYFCTCNGKLHLEAADGTDPMDTEAYHHDAVWYVDTTMGIGMFPSGLHYHDDKMLNSLAAKVGTTISWRD